MPPFARLLPADSRLSPSALSDSTAARSNSSEAKIGWPLTRATTSGPKSLDAAEIFDASTARSGKRFPELPAHNQPDHATLVSKERTVSRYLSCRGNCSGVRIEP